MSIDYNLKCTVCGSDAKCVAGCSAHHDNWYCPVCDARSRIDIIGHNGPSGEHYEDKVEAWARHKEGCMCDWCLAGQANKLADVIQTKDESLREAAVLLRRAAHLIDKVREEEV